MTRDELKELACLGFSADLVMQSFCHTAAYPKPVDIQSPITGLFLYPGWGGFTSGRWHYSLLVKSDVIAGYGGDWNCLHLIFVNLLS